jgi:LysM repeat protein
MSRIKDNKTNKNQNISQKQTKEQEITFPYYDWKNNNYYASKKEYDYKAPQFIPWHKVSQETLNEVNKKYNLGYKTDKKGNVVRNEYTYSPIYANGRKNFPKSEEYNKLYENNVETNKRRLEFEKTAKIKTKPSSTVDSGGVKIARMIQQIGAAAPNNNPQAVEQRNAQAKQRQVQQQTENKDYIENQKKLGELFLNSAALATSIVAMGSQIGNAVYNNKANNLLFRQGYATGINNPKYINYTNIANDLDSIYKVTDAINLPLDIAQFATSSGPKEQVYNGIQLGLSGIKYVPINNPAFGLIKPVTSFVGNLMEPISLGFKEGGPLKKSYKDFYTRLSEIWNNQDLSQDDYINQYEKNQKALGGNLFANGSWMPSKQWQNRISAWEGSSMYKPAPDTGRVNRSFEAERKDFINSLPKKALNKLSQESLDALYSYSYNVGAGNFRKRVVPVLNKYLDGKASAEEVARNMYATKDRQLRGLQKRRRFERNAFYKGETGKNLTGKAYEDLSPLQTAYNRSKSFSNYIPTKNQYNSTEELNPSIQNVDPQTFIDTIQKQVKEANYGESFLKNVDSNNSYLNSIYNSSINEERQNINNEIVDNEIVKYLSVLDNNNTVNIGNDTNENGNLFAEGGSTYTVKKGDNLWDIAQKNNIPLQSLIENNQSNNQINFNQRISNFSSDGDVGYNIEDAANIFHAVKEDNADIKKLKELKATGQWDSKYDKLPKEYVNMLYSNGTIPIVQNANTGLFQPIKRANSTYTVTFPNFKRINRELKELEEAKENYEKNSSSKDEKLLQELGEKVSNAKAKVLANYNLFSSEKLGKEFNEKVAKLGITSKDIDNAKFYYLKNKNRTSEEEEEFTRLANQRVKDKYEDLSNQYNELAYNYLLRNTTRGLGAAAAFYSGGLSPLATNLVAGFLPHNSFTDNRYVQEFINDFNNPANGLISIGGDLARYYGVDENIVNAAEAGANVMADLVLSGGKSLFNPRVIKTTAELSKLGRLQRNWERFRSVVSPNYQNIGSLAKVAGVVGGSAGISNYLTNTGHEDAGLAVSLLAGAALPNYKAIANQAGSKIGKAVRMFQTGAGATVPYAATYGGAKWLGLDDNQAANVAGLLSNFYTSPFIQRPFDPLSRFLSWGFRNSAGNTGGADSVPKLGFNILEKSPWLVKTLKFTRDTIGWNPVRKLGVNIDETTPPDGFGHIEYNGRDAYTDNPRVIDTDNIRNMQHGSNVGTEYTTVDGITGTIPSHSEVVRTLKGMEWDYHNGYQTSSANIPVPLLDIKAGNIVTPEGKTAVFTDGKVVNTPLQKGDLDYNPNNNQPVIKVEYKTKDTSQLSSQYLKDRYGKQLPNLSTVREDLQKQGYTLEESKSFSYFDSDKGRSIGTGNRQLFNKEGEMYSKQLNTTPNTKGSIMHINVWKHPTDINKDMITVSIIDRYSAGVASDRTIYQKGNNTAAQELYKSNNGFSTQKDFLSKHALPIKEDGVGYSGTEVLNSIQGMIDEVSSFSKLKSYKDGKSVKRSIFDMQENPSATPKQDFETYFKQKVQKTVQERLQTVIKNRVASIDKKINKAQQKGDLEEVKRLQKQKKDCLENPISKTKALEFQREVFSILNNNISKYVTSATKIRVSGSKLRNTTNNLTYNMQVDDGTQTYSREYLQQNKAKLQKAYDEFGETRFKFKLEDLPKEYQDKIKKATAEGKVTLEDFANERGVKDGSTTASIKDLYEAGIDLNLNVFTKSVGDGSVEPPRDNFMQTVQLLKFIE